MRFEDRMKSDINKMATLHFDSKGKILALFTSGKLTDRSK